MSPRPAAPIEGVDDAELAKVATSLPSLPVVDAETPDRFAQAVRAVLERRAQAGWPNETNADVSVFVFVERPRQIGDLLGAVPILDPIATADPLFGRLLLLNRDASGGRWINLPCPQGEILDWLSAQGLGDQPCVIAYRGTKTMVTRRDGVTDTSLAYPIRDNPPTATIPELLSALSHFHKEKLLTPTVCVKGVWEPRRSSNHIPGRDPERQIQQALEFALNFWFHGVVRADVEDRTKIGRIDVRLMQPSSDGPLMYWAIIELKVIKSFAHAPRPDVPNPIRRSENIAVIVEGFRQAWAFADERLSEEGLLEVFDLRVDKQDDLLTDRAVVRAVRRLNPVPRHHVRPVFGSARLARQAGFSGR
jgi:hypothetical protein